MKGRFCISWTTRRCYIAFTGSSAIRRGANSRWSRRRRSAAEGSLAPFTPITPMSSIPTIASTTRCMPTLPMPNDSIAFEDVIAAYRDAIERQPLQYEKTGHDVFPGVEQHTYLLTSQSWSPEGLVQPAQ